MTIRVAINGYGRIGRNILRAHYESGKKHDIAIVAINDLGNAETNAHLTRYDTAHGKFPGTVAVDGDHMVVNGDRIRVFAVRNPAEIPWGSLNVDVVLECTGLFTSKEKAGAHLKGGAKKVIISAPGGKDVDATVVYGVNHKTLKAAHTVISNASCTTNCLAPMAKVLHEKIGLVSGLMTTVHAYTNDQVLTDVYHEDLRRARSATMSMIPTKTGAAQEVRGSLLLGGEEAGALVHDVHFQLAPGQLRGVAVGQHADAVAVDDHVVAVHRHGARELAVRRVVAGEVGVGLGVAEVVHRDDHDVVLLAALVVGAEDVSADAAVAVDGDADGHGGGLQSGVNAGETPILADRGPAA